MSSHYTFDSDRFLIRREASGSLLFDRRTSVFHNLNDTATEIVRLLSDGFSKAAILSRLVSLYKGPDTAALEADFAEFEQILMVARVICADEKWTDKYRSWPIDDYRAIRMEEAEFVARHLGPPDSRILDLGSGSGVYAKHFADRGRFTRADCSLDVLAAAREPGPCLAADMAHLPLRAGCFDVVLATGHVLGYLSGHLRSHAVSEMIRVIRPGGRLIFSVWTEHAIPERFGDRQSVRDPFGQESLVHFFDDRELDLLFEGIAVTDVLTLSRSGDFGREFHAYCCTL